MIEANTRPIGEPFALRVPDAQEYSGLSRSELYRCLADGRLRAVKSGKTTLIVMHSLRAYLGSLPQATFRAPKSAA